MRRKPRLEFGLLTADRARVAWRSVFARRAAARELGKKLGVDIKAGYLAIGTYDLIIHAEATGDAAMAKFLLSLASQGNVRTTTVEVFPEADFDKIIAALV